MDIVECKQSTLLEVVKSPSAHVNFKTLSESSMVLAYVIILLISEIVKQNTQRRVIPSMVALKISFAVALYTLGSSFMSTARFSAIVIDSIVTTKSRNRSLLIRR